MTRIKFIDKDTQPTPSPGSTGFRKSAEPGQHVNHRANDEIARLNQRILDLEKMLAAADAEIKDLKEEQAGDLAEFGDQWRKVVAEKDAEIAQLKADYDKRVFSEFPDFGAAMSETETETETRSETETDMSTTEVDKKVDLSVEALVMSTDEVDKQVMSTKRQRYIKGQEPWTLDGISRQAWYKKRTKEHNARLRDGE